MTKKEIVFFITISILLLIAMFFLLMLGSSLISYDVSDDINSNIVDSQDFLSEVKIDPLITSVSTLYKSLIKDTDPVKGAIQPELIIMEFGDFECPYCAKFHLTLKQIVEESNGNISWIYRHWPIHQHSFEKLIAAECIAKLKGSEAFWQYTDILFGMLQEPTQPTSIFDQL